MGRCAANVFFGNSRCRLCGHTHPSGFDCQEAAERERERMRALPVRSLPHVPRPIFTIVRTEP